jgi:DNA-binding transcriptional regulator YbjK
MAGVTHRSVTEQAGLPLATVSYFFDSINALTAEALHACIETEADAQIAVAAELAQSHSTLDEVAAAFGAATKPRTPETLAFFEACLHAARDPSFRDAVSKALAATRRATAAGARAAGAPAPDATAPAFAALSHGLALHQLAVPDSLPPDAVHAALRALFLGFLVDNGHAELALHLRRHATPPQ